MLSETPICSDAFRYLFTTAPPPEPDYTGDHLDPCYFEGFPGDLVFGYYTNDNRRWSAEIHGVPALWATLFLCMKELGGLSPLRYLTRAEHLADIERRNAARGDKR